MYDAENNSDKYYDLLLSKSKTGKEEYHPTYYVEKRARERQIVELENVPFGRERDSIFVRERDFERYYRTLEQSYVQEREKTFCGPDDHFQEPRTQAPRMPYYPQQHRTAFPTPVARGCPSWQQPSYRSNPPRRRHHLDDIFLPNHDDEEYPAEEEGYQSTSRNSGSRPPVRIEVKTIKPATATKGRSASAIRNVKVSEKNIDVKSCERTITLANKKDAVKAKPECSKSSENVNTGTSDGIKSVVKSSAGDKILEVSKSTGQTANVKKNDTNSVRTISLQKISETSGKPKDANKTQVLNRKNSASDNSRSEIKTKNNTTIIITTVIQNGKANDTNKKDNVKEVPHFTDKQGKCEIIKTVSPDNKKIGSKKQIEIPSEDTTLRKAVVSIDDKKTAESNKDHVKASPHSTDNQTKCEITKPVRLDNKKIGSKKQIAISSEDTTLTKTVVPIGNKKIDESNKKDNIKDGPHSTKCGVTKTVSLDSKHIGSKKQIEISFEDTTLRKAVVPISSNKTDESKKKDNITDSKQTKGGITKTPSLDSKKVDNKKQIEKPYEDTTFIKAVVPIGNNKIDESNKKYNLKEAPHSTDKQTKCGITKTLSVDGKKQMERPSKDTTPTKAVVRIGNKEISKSTSDALKNEDETTSGKVNNQSTCLVSKPQDKNVTDKKSVISGEKINSKHKASEKSVKIKSSKNDIENKDKEKLQKEEEPSINKTTNKEGQQISNSTTDKNKSRQNVPNKKDIEPKSVEQELQKSVTMEDTTISDKDGSKLSNICSKHKKSNIPAISGAKEQNDSDSEIDIVKELEDLVNKPDTHALTVNKFSEEPREREEQTRKDDDNKLIVNPDKETTQLEEGNLTHDTTPTSVPSSPQAIKKDIRIKLIRLPLPKRSLATDKTNKNCDQECESNLSLEISTKNGREDGLCSWEKLDGSAIRISKPMETKRTDNLSPESVDENLNTNNITKSTGITVVQTPDNSASADTINIDNKGNTEKNCAILEDIFILEDALKDIDNPQIIEVPSSPSKDVGSTNTLNTQDCDIIEICSTPKRTSPTVIDCDKDDSQDVQIVEDNHDTIEIIDDEDDNLSSAVKGPVISTALGDVIKIESPEDFDDSSSSPSIVEVSQTLENQRPLGDFGNLDTRSSFLWTFHQRFDDPRVVDMDISHSPSPSTSFEEPVRTEQQEVTDRVIKDMDALWDEISNNKIDEHNISKKMRRNVELKDNPKVSEEKRGPTNDKIRFFGLEDNKMNPEKATNRKQVKELKKNYDTVRSLNKSISDTEILTKSSEGIKSTENTNSPLYKNSVLKCSKRYTINEGASVGRRASFCNIPYTDTLKTSLCKTKSLNDLSSINKINVSCTQTGPNKLQENHGGNLISKDKRLEDYLNKSQIEKLLFFLNGPKSQNPICNIRKSSGKESSSKTYTIHSDKVHLVPSVVGNNLISANTSPSTDDSSSSLRIHNINEKITKNKQKRTRKRVRRIESSDEDQPKPKKQILKEKSNRKRHDNKKIKEPRKEIEATNISLACKLTEENSCSEIGTSSSTATKYVTKAEYVKTFAKNKSFVSQISLSIEPVIKEKSVKRRRATFTCESDNQTILKKVKCGERCKQKFLDLFGSDSEDENNLIGVPSTEAYKMSLGENKELGNTQGEKNSLDVLTPKKDIIDEKRKRSYVSTPSVEENNTSSESSESFKSNPKKHKVMDSKRISKETDTSPTKNLENETIIKLKRQKSNEQSVQKHYKHTKSKNINKRRESTSSTDSRSRESCCQKYQKNKKCLENAQLKKARRDCPSQSKEGGSVSDMEKDVRKMVQRGCWSQSKESGTDIISNTEKHIRRKAERDSRSQSKDSDTSIVSDMEKDIRKKVERGCRSQSKESDTSITGDTEKHIRRKAERISRSESKESDTSIVSDKEKYIRKKAERGCRSQSKESDTSIVSDTEKHLRESKISDRSTDMEKRIRKSTHSKEKDEKVYKERFDKGYSHYSKSRQHSFKGLTDRRDSSSSNESSISTKQKVDQKLPENNVLGKIDRQRKSLSQDGKASYKNKKETISVSDLKQKDKEVIKPQCEDINVQDAVLRTELSITEIKKKMTEHLHKVNQKSEFYASNETDAFSEKIISKDESASGKIKQTINDTKYTADPIKKLKESYRRNSAPDSLSTFSETSLVIKKTESFPILYRSSESEIQEMLQNCKIFTANVTKFQKITKIISVYGECMEKVYVSEPPEIYNDTKTITQENKEDDDVIEIRPVIPMIDLTEEDTKKDRESSPQESLGDLLLKAKKEIEELAQDQSTITLYRSEENDTNQDEEVQAVAVSIPLLITDKNSLKIKQNKNLPQQDTIITSTSEPCSQATAEKTPFGDGEEINLENNEKQKTSGAPETVSPDASLLFSNMVQNLAITASPHGDNTTLNSAADRDKSSTETPVISHQPVTEETPSTLEEENQRAVSFILDIWQSNQHSKDNTNSSESIQTTSNQNSAALQSITLPSKVVNNVDVQNANELVQPITTNNLEGMNSADQGKSIFETSESTPIHQTVESEKSTEKSNYSVEQTSRSTVECQTTINEPHKTFSSDTTDKNRRPRIIVRPTRAEQNIEAFKRPNLDIRLGEAQNKIVQESFGQHKGLPQTLREYRPSRKFVKVTSTCIPPLVNINATSTSPQKNSHNSVTPTILQNVLTRTNRTTSEESNQVSIQNSRATENRNNSVSNLPLIDLTGDNGELSIFHMRIIVDIFTRHLYFLAHLCQAQNDYIEYLRQKTFCQSYFKAETSLFEGQKQSRLISQSLRLATELENLNIRATKNLSGSASSIVEQVAVNLANRDMPKQVTRSMVYLLIAQLIKPQSDIFAKVPLLKALIRLCNIVMGRLSSKCPGPLTEAQRKILSRQVEEYNKMFGRRLFPQNQVNTIVVSTPTNNQLMVDNHLNIEMSQPRSQTVNAMPINQPFLRNQINGQTGSSVDGSEQPVHFSSPSVAKLSHIFGSPQQPPKNSSSSVPLPRGFSGGANNASVGPGSTIEAGNSPAMFQTSVGSNLMNPPNYNVPISQQRKSTNTRQPSLFVLPNNSHQMAKSHRVPRDLPGGANTNSLGCTPRYIPNYDKPNESHVYASLRNSLPPPRSNQSVNTRSIATNEDNLNHTNNVLLSRILSENNSNSSRNCAAQQSPLQNSVAQSPQYESSYRNFLQRSQSENVVSQSPRLNVLSDSPRHSVISQSPRHVVLSQSPRCEGNSFRQPPSYDEAVNNLTYSSSTPLPNQLTAEDARKRNENLLSELLSTADNEPVFARPSSPANDNFRIKLPFTKPEQTPSTTVLTSSANTLNHKEKTPSLSTIVSVSNTVIPKTSSTRTQNKTLNASEPVTVSVLNSQQVSTLYSNAVVTISDVQNNQEQTFYSQPSIQSSQNATLVNLGSTSATSQAPVVLVNNTAASTKYVVGQPEKNVVLNQGLAALSSIGQASAMLNSSSHTSPVQNSQPAINVQYSLKNQAFAVTNQPLLYSSGTTQSVSPVLIMTGPNVFQLQNQSPTNFKEVAAPSQIPSYMITPSNSTQASSTNSTNNTTASTDKGNTSKPYETYKFNIVSGTSSIKPKSKVSKPKSKSGPKPKPAPKPKPKSKKRGRSAKQKKGASSKQIEIVDLLSSDEEMPLEIQSQEAEPKESTSEEIESNSIKLAEAKFQVEVSEVDDQYIEQHTADDQSVDPQESCQLQVPPKDLIATIPDTQTQDPQPSTTENLNNDLLPPSPKRQVENTRPSKDSNTIEEDDIETIDLTWIDDMDDQELQREMEFVCVKKEEPRDEEEERNNSVVPSPADSGISSPPIQAEEETTVYTVNVQRLCICSKTAQYNCVCGDAWYCGQDCQLSDWLSHQKVCQVANGNMCAEEEQFVLNEGEMDIPAET